MTLPKVPRWFTNHLRLINPDLGARFNPGSQMWEITESVPVWVDLGRWGMTRLVELQRQPKRILSIPEIGSRAFVELNKLWGPKFDGGYDEFVKLHNLRTG